MGPVEKEIQIVHESDVALARQASGRLAEQAGLDTTQKHCVMTSVSELATNILNHSERGSVIIRIVARAEGIKGIEVVAADQGPGILDTNLAMQDGYSTTGTLGGGLGGAKRLMSEMEISSSVGKGTIVRAVKWVDDSSAMRRTSFSSEHKNFQRDTSVLNRPRSDHSTGPGKNRRRFERIDVAWHGQCESEITVVRGTIKNVSLKGAFFLPSICVDDEETIRPGEASNIFIEGGTWTLSLMPGYEVEPLVVEAKVRWIGYQFKHASDGIGFEFDSRLPEIARLVAK